MSETQTSVLSPPDLTAVLLCLQETTTRRFDHLDGRLLRLECRLDRANEHLDMLEVGQVRLEGGQTDLTKRIEAIQAHLAEDTTRRDDAMAEARAHLREELGRVRAEMSRDLAGVQARFDRVQGVIDARFAKVHGEMDARFAKVDGDMETRFGRVHQGMNDRFAAVGSRFVDVDQRFDEMDRRFGVVDAQMRAIAEAVGAPVVESPGERSN